MDFLGFGIDRAAVRLLVSTIVFFLVQTGIVDPIFSSDAYREHIVDIVSAILVIIFAVEFVFINVIKLWHKFRNDPNYIEKPNQGWVAINNLFSKYIVVKPGFSLFKVKADTLPPADEPLPPQDQPAQ
jgi:hypothetical protein